MSLNHFMKVLKKLLMTLLGVICLRIYETDYFLSISVRLFPADDLKNFFFL